MRTSLPILDYFARFRCIGAACEDNCCGNWTVPVDREAYEKYQQLKPGPLRTLLNESLVLTDNEGVQAAGFKAPEFHAKIRLNSAHQCPLLSTDHLCKLQMEDGSGYLSHTCATYPRIVQKIGQIEDTALTLACPEAARLVLLNPELFPADESISRPEANDGGSVPQDSGAQPICPSSCLPDNFGPIRALILTLVRNRAYPLWQRLFLLGVLCRRLDSIAAGELQRNVADFLRDFEATVSSGSLHTAMESIPVDLTSQLDVVLRLAGLLLHRSQVSPRFVDTVKAFTAGIGNGPNADLGTLTAHYALAHDRYYAPFFSRYPHILENYLVNTIVRCRFPFGKHDSKTSSDLPGSMTGEFALLTAQFALMKGLLIGVAGFYRDRFAPVHVVHTVQSASRHFEHHPEFLNLARALLVESGMDGARGLTVLLRNGTATLPKSAPLDAGRPFAADASKIHRPGSVGPRADALPRSKPQEPHPADTMNN